MIKISKFNVKVFICSVGMSLILCGCGCGTQTGEDHTEDKGDSIEDRTSSGDTKIVINEDRKKECTIQDKYKVDDDVQSIELGEPFKMSSSNKHIIETPDDSFFNTNNVIDENADILETGHAADKNNSGKIMDGEDTKNEQEQIEVIDTDNTTSEVEQLTEIGKFCVDEVACSGFSVIASVCDGGIGEREALIRIEMLNSEIEKLDYYADILRNTNNDIISDWDRFSTLVKKSTEKLIVCKNKEDLNNTCKNLDIADIQRRAYTLSDKISNYISNKRIKEGGN